MDRIGMSYKKLLIALCFPALSWASYQPVNGSTVNIQNVTTTVNTVSTSTVITGTLPAFTANPTVNIGNTQNTTAILTTSSGTSIQTVTPGSGTFTVSGTVTANPGNTQNTTAWQTVSTNTVVTSTQTDNGVAASGNRLATLPTIYQNNYLNGTGATQGRNGALSQGTDGLLWTSNLPAMRPASYSASTNTFTLINSTQDFTGLCGNAGNTVLVYDLRLSCTQTTAGNMGVEVVKRSSAYTGQAAAGVVWSTMTMTAQDSNYAVAQSSAIFMTANNLVNGTLVGHLDNYQLGCMAAATATPNDIYISPASWRMKPIVLRGTTQCVGVNVAGTTISGTKFTATWDWIETTTITP